MRQFAAKAGGNAIAYSDPNENAIAYSLAEAMAESGGFIGTAWNKPDDVGPADLTPNWVIHTSPDNSVNGYNIAKVLFESMGGKGKIFVCEGMLGNTAAIDRAKGLDLALAEYPDIEVAGRDTANWATSEALTLVETWLSQNADVGGIWCANDNMATGALQALDKAGLKGKVGVVGVDANPTSWKRCAMVMRSPRFPPTATCRAATPWRSATRPGLACWMWPSCRRSIASSPPRRCSSPRRTPRST
jgi:ribose transport system substrate-binding protein